MAKRRGVASRRQRRAGQLQAVVPWRLITCPSAFDADIGERVCDCWDNRGAGDDVQGMSSPRTIVPGRYYLITRRCTQRQFLLRPGNRTNRAFRYCLAEAAQRYGIEVVAFCAESNHHHTLIYDPHGNLSAFLAHFHKMLAKVLNAKLGRWENFFATEQTCVTECLDPEAIFDKTVYTLTNPAKDQLVDKVFNWPGENSYAAQLQDRTLVAERPEWFFDPDGNMPLAVELSFHRPRGFEALSQQQWADKLRTAVEAVEAKAAKERAESGTFVLGRKTVLLQSPFGKPKSSEPRRKLRPRFASKSAERRIEAIRQRKSFLERYRNALAKLRDGVRDVVFPAGTYLLRVRGLVQCEPLPAPS
jgi:REP element-mobilizing transposase RayT